MFCIIDCHEEKWWEWTKGVKPQGREWTSEIEQEEALCKTVSGDFTSIIFLENFRIFLREQKIFAYVLRLLTELSLSRLTHIFLRKSESVCLCVCVCMYSLTWCLGVWNRFEIVWKRPPYFSLSVRPHFLVLSSRIPCFQCQKILSIFVSVWFLCYFITTNSGRMSLVRS